MLLSLSTINRSLIKKSKVGQSWNTFFLRRKTTNVSPDYQYLQRSKLKTLHFQRSLPNLPVPPLDQTCERYLSALGPIINDSKQYQGTVKHVKEFQQGAGVELQKELLAWAKKNRHTSYISDAWFDMYLKSRAPIVLNYNPFMSYKQDPVEKYNNQLVRSSNFVISAARFKKSLEANCLEPEVFHLNPKKSDTDTYRTLMKLTPQSIAFYASAIMNAYPLDMSQFGNLFNSTRIPRLGKDEIVRFPDTKHVAVLRNGQFYIFDVFDSEGNIKEPTYIYSCMQHIKGLKDVKGDSITVFSTEDRDQWAIARDQLIKHPKNAENLDMVDKALFIVCLDDLKYGKDLLQHGHNFLHGNNGPGKPLNRWFDKSFSLIFTEDSECAINFEHSWGDGLAILRFFNETYYDTTKNRFVSPETPKHPQFNANSDVKHLSFTLDDQCKAAAVRADKRFREHSGRFKFSYDVSESLTRNMLKEKKVSPDSMFQLGFQMAFYKVYGFTPTTYESCSTAAFKKGRTEVVRAATMETKKTTAAFLTKDKHSASDLRKMLDDCSRKHSQLTKEAAMGRGFDRHLFALRLLAEKHGHKLEIFTDKSYQDCNYFTLSTSSLYGECFSGGGFAAVVDDGYGVGYGYVENKLGTMCSTYSRDSDAFINAFRESMSDIHKVLEKF